VVLPEGTNGVARVRNNLARFMHTEEAGAIVLAIATLAAIVIANSPLWVGYNEFWRTYAGFHIGGLEFEQSLLHWVDDALMALFFFVIGLEIKREVVVGELSTVKGAALPVVAAIGGMIAPAAIYLALNAGRATMDGWGIPMATDIAFALGVLALLGDRIPSPLKVFLVALAIADDIGAILVIALFYTDDIKVVWLLAALVPLALLVLMNRLRVDEPLAYLVMGVVLWFAILNSGIHATIAGVIAALTVPTVARVSPTQFTQACRLTLDEIDAIDVPGAHTLEDDRQQKLALALAEDAQLSASPLQRLEFALLPFTTFVVLPLFALANAGIRFVGTGGFDFMTPAVLGVMLGLIVGKPLGIVLASFLAVRFGKIPLPPGVGWRHVLGAGMLGGIGFTMSIFVANLAFEASGPLNEVKAAILIASLIAGTVGYCWLRFFAPKAERRTPA